jgi:amidase
MPPAIESIRSAGAVASCATETGANVCTGATLAMQVTRQPASLVTPSGQQGQSPISSAAGMSPAQGIDMLVVPESEPAAATADTIGADNSSCASTSRWMTGRKRRFTRRNIGFTGSERQQTEKFAEKLRPAPVFGRTGMLRAMKRLSRLVLVLGSLVACAPALACPEKFRLGPIDLNKATLDDLATALARKKFTSSELTSAYLDRITGCNAEIRAVISTNRFALREARRLDAERAAGKIRGPMHGIPVIIKDNIDLEGAVTTAGSFALADNRRDTNAPLVDRLVASGAIIIAKANLSEWANFRSRQSTSGWSAVGGLVANGRDPLRSACGSSSGSAVAVVAHFAPVAVGTETNGSIVCPSSVNGLVGFKPSVGMIPQVGIVPISRTQDAAGPMAANVTDAALLLGAMTVPARDFRARLDANALEGVRLGVARFIKGFAPRTEQAFNEALAVLKAGGAELVYIEQFDFADIRDLEMTILTTEFKAGINEYLATTPPGVKARTLEALISFNREEPRELEWFGQDLFETSQATRGLDDATYTQALQKALGIARGGIDRLLAEHKVVALVAPTSGPAWSIDLVNGDRSVGSSSMLPAVAGYPHLTVPMGQAGGLPVGLSFMGTAGSDAQLLSLGYAFEQAQEVPGEESGD